MLSFEVCVARHGEYWVQDILEGIERREGIHKDATASLGDRWHTIMQTPPAARTAGCSVNQARAAA
jgi:hypothetical protein